MTIQTLPISTEARRERGFVARLLRALRAQRLLKARWPRHRRMGAWEEHASFAARDALACMRAQSDDPE